MLFRKFAVDFAEKYRTEPIRLDEQARMLIENYSWPGNIRELKNLAEQISVLAEDKLVTPELFIQQLPQITKRNLPMISEPYKTGEQGAASMQEREIFYKLMIDMKNDLNDLKTLVFELIRNNDLRVPDAREIRGLQAPRSSHAYTPPPSNGRQQDVTDFLQDYHEDSPSTEQPDNSIRPIILPRDEHQEQFAHSEEVEANLSLEENEKRLIQTALKKHKGRRKDASAELGISERTLYRKIKQYEL